MRILSSVTAAGRYAVALVVIAGSIAMFGAAKKSNFTTHDKAYYADPSVIEYIQPGLVFSVVSASIAKDGTIAVDFKIADPTGAALDRSGVTTPGAVSSSFLIAYVPKGQQQFASYITRTATAATGGATATQAAGDSGGTYQTVATGEYIYTFSTKASTGYDPTATHRVGIYGSRNLTQWDLGTNYASTTFDWVPAGNGAQPAPRDVVRTPDCNKCHDQLAFHGGSRRGVDLCIMCHQPQSTDPNTGNTLDMKVMAHKIHMGSSLPSVQAGKPYQIVGFQNAVSDWSTVVYPATINNCQTCHNPNNGAAQTNAWLTTPTAAACGSCHDDVNLATGVNHAGGPQPDDNECATCHIQKGELPFDASIMGAHVLPTSPSVISGEVITITKVQNTLAGQAPVVSFTIKDNKGNPLALSALEDISFTMAGPTSDYGNTSFGSDVTTPGVVTEDGSAATCDSSRSNCSFTFKHTVPAKATGTYAIAVESEKLDTVLPGTTAQQTIESGTPNQVVYFSVDGTPVQNRRVVVATSNCNNCHFNLQGHGARRNSAEYCVFCHNPSLTDASTRATSKSAADLAQPPQALNFALMVHKIHTGVNLAAMGATYVEVSHNGRHIDFGAAFASVPASIPNTGVRYPAMSPTGAVHDTTNCSMCHTGGSEGVFPIGKNPVTDPQGLLNPAPATTSACTACHLNTFAFAHAVSQTDSKFGESCSVCHASGTEFDVDAVHAGQ